MLKQTMAAKTRNRDLTKHKSSTLSLKDREEIQSLHRQAEEYLRLQLLASKERRFEDFQEYGKRYSNTVRKIEGLRIKHSSSDSKRVYAKEYYLPLPK